MGADGGVVILPILDNETRVYELLSIFPELLNLNAHSSTNDYLFSEWEANNLIPYTHVYGHYGTDCAVCLQDLKEVCVWECNNELFDLTFEEFSLEVLTAPFGVNTYGIEEFYTIWEWYFYYDTHEEIVEKLGQFKDVTINEWRAELNSLVDFSRMWTEEVWT
jgi:hypothetical protein